MPKVKSQISLDDQWVKNPEVEALLEKREGLKGGASDYRKVN